MIPLPIYIALFGQLLIVSWIDIKKKKISNYWSLLNIVLFIVFIFIFPNYYGFQLNTFIYPITFISVGFLLFAIKIMGAGDAKYLFSFFLLIPKVMQDYFFLTLLWTTIIIGLSSLTITIVQNLSKIIFAFKTQQILSLREIFGSKFPYAPVIFLAWMWVGWVLRLNIL